jgi:hypothetical protein
MESPAPGCSSGRATSGQQWTEPTRSARSTVAWRGLKYRSLAKAHLHCVLTMLVQGPRLGMMQAGHQEWAPAVVRFVASRAPFGLVPATVPTSACPTVRGRVGDSLETS